MDPVVVGVVIALAGVAVGLSAGLAFRISERGRSDGDVTPVPTVPEGLDAVIAVMRSSAIVLDPALSVVKASPSVYALGFVRHHRLAVPEAEALAREVQRDGQVREAQISLERSRSSVQTVHIAIRAGKIGHGLVLVLLEDVTPTIRNDEVRRDFVANVSHELKTPVGALMLLSEAIGEASDDPPAVRRFAERMRREGQRLNRLVQEIIDLSRLQYDDPVASPEPVDVDDLVAAALDRIHVDAETRDQRLVSGGTSGLDVLGDEKQLLTALGNLVENAINYSPEHTRVAVGVRERGDMVEISVTDQGFGIPEAELDRIFERFYRVDQARSRATGGTGLGLSIVKHIAASHGGEVTVWSAPGAGSTFTLRLPRYNPGAEQSLGAGQPIAEGSP